jgi:peptidoglycan-associated lipoprotein
MSQCAFRLRSAALLTLLLVTVACGAREEPPIARPLPDPPPAVSDAARTPPPPTPVPDPVVVPPEPVLEDDIASRSLDELNTDSPLRPAFFAYDSAELNAEAQRALDANAETLRRYGTWTITVEGHTDERGTAEYNLALGERRAAAARTYLVSLGIPADRLRMVSYGKEFPFDPGHDEAAWSMNRRAHFVITAK